MTGETQCRDPLPTVRFFWIGVAGLGLTGLACFYFRVSGNGVVASVALWLAILFAAEGIWDRFVADGEWIRLEPRSLPLPGKLAWVKPFLPVAAFGAGIIGGHKLWY